MKLEITLKSDLCTSSGDTFNSYIDTDVAYDEFGFPLIKGKTIKGCIRECGQELVDFGVISTNDFNVLFGEKENACSLFHLDSARIQNREMMIEDILAASDPVLTTPQKVLNLYTYVRSNTALKNGIADEKTLRNIRVVKKDTVFEADLEYSADITEDQRTAFENAVSMVKHMGMSRTRGLGLVNMALIPDAAEDGLEETPVQQKNVYLEKVNSDGLYQLDYEIELLSPMICKSETGDQTKSQDYISGSKVLGKIVEKIGSDTYRSLSSEVTFNVSNAYLKADGSRCTAISKSLQKVKDSYFQEDSATGRKELVVYEQLDGYEEDEQLTSVGRYYLTKDGFANTVNMEINYHHKRPDDKSKGRATGKDNSAFYQLESICAGQTFAGFVLADEKTASVILDKMPDTFHTRMGYGRSSEYGSVNFKWTGCNKIRQSEKDDVLHSFTIKLNAPLIMYNSCGCLAADVETLADYLGRALGVTDIKAEKIFAEYTTIGGYNVTWQARKPMFQALAQGTVCRFSSEAGVKSSELSGRFIGERTREGFGEIELYRNIGVYEHIQGSKSDHVKKGDFKTDIIRNLIRSQHMLDAECRGRRDADELVESEKLKEKKGIDAVVGKLILIYREEADYSSFRDQVDGIETDSKRSLAQTIADQIECCVDGYTGAYLNPAEVFKCYAGSLLLQIKYKIRPTRDERRESSDTDTTEGENNE